MAGVITEINSLADLISKSVNFAGELRNGWYRLSNDLENFPLLVESLRLKQDMWESLLRRNGMSADDFMKPTLEAAIVVLDREASRVEKMQARCCGGFGHKITFPGDVESSIKKVIQAFDEIYEKMKERDDLNDLFEKVQLHNPTTLPFSHDKKYVPLKNTLFRVQEALECADGPRVVTLHGGPGTGKSTLAIYLALCYQDMNQASSSARGKKRRRFEDGVFFLACGAGAEGRSKLAEVLQILGSKIWIPDPSQENQDQQEVQPAAYHTEFFLRKRLHARLTEQNILIILDDVWESRILQCLLVPGKGLRYLVTTQRADLWGDSFRINIDKPGLQEARMILANHVVGLSNGELPLHLQGIADDIILASESNPLILANLALAINSHRATDAGEWELKKNALLDVLEGEDNDKGPVRFDQKYPRSVAASMMMAVNSLESDAKSMLFLASLCEGPSVPETVVRMFFKRIYGRLKNFTKWADYLEDHSLIQIQTQTIPGSSVYCRTWSIHATRQHFILKDRDEVTKIISSLLTDRNFTVGDGTDAHLVAALCHVYVKKSLMRAVETGVQNVSVHLGTYIEGADLVRRSIEPLVWLLQLQGGVDEQWQQQAHRHAGKVILQYVVHGDLDNVGMASLLELPQTASATCWALQAMALVQEQPLLISDSGGTLLSLLSLLAGDGDPPTQRRATEALCALAEKNHEYILSHQSVLETFMLLLRRNSNPVLQEGAAWALGTLACSKESRDVLGGYLGLLETLVGLLNDDIDVHIRVRRSAAYALVRLTSGLGSSKPVLEGLMGLLASDANPGIQVEAVKFLSKLTGAQENQAIIALYPGTLKRLFALIGRNTNAPAHVQMYACVCLANLALDAESRMAIAALPNAVRILEELLAENVGKDVQALAAMCLANLDHVDDALKLQLDKPLSSTAQLLMSDVEPNDNIYISLRNENLEIYRKLHMQPWLE